jgi:hypothetical protein
VTDADVGAAVRIVLAQGHQSTFAHGTAAAITVLIGLAEVGLAVVAVVGALALLAAIAGFAALVAAVLGLGLRTVLLGVTRLGGEGKEDADGEAGQATECAPTRWSLIEDVGQSIKPGSVHTKVLRSRQRTAVEARRHDGAQSLLSIVVLRGVADSDYDLHETIPAHNRTMPRFPPVLA